MKTTKILKSLTAFTIACSMISCSSDYLNTEPITNVPADKVGATTQAAQLAVHGICRMMYTQWGTSSPRGSNGEATLDQVINEVFGPDNTSVFNMGELGPNWYTWRLMDDKNATINNSAWEYCYVFIARANDILSTISNAEGSEEERKWIEAQARTLRAHGYIKALQWFAPRWQDSNNGEKMSVILRTEPGTGPAPLAPMKDVLKLIYDDLTKAIQLYQESGMGRQQWWEPDIEIAYGLFARAALLKDDWATALAMASAARDGYGVMSANEYLSGFVNEASDYMWTNGENDVYYSSYGAWFSCNGAYPTSWAMGFSINLDLYDQLDPNDIRALCFFTPDKIQEIASLNPAFANAAKLKYEDFWNEDFINGELDCAAQNDDMYDMCRGFVYFSVLNNPIAQDYSITTWPYTPGRGFQPSCMNLGAQVKMWSTGWNGVYCDSKYPYMRATEMVLIEAEAAYMSGDEQTAKARLTEVNSKRIASYSCKTSGQALLDEIRLCRRIELWGEGFNFTDFKRWNLPAEERAWKNGDITSGNTVPSYASSHNPSDCNGWRLAIPQSEEDFNPAFDRTQLN